LAVNRGLIMIKGNSYPPYGSSKVLRVIPDPTSRIGSFAFLLKKALSPSLTPLF
jgi:hypothetical protein